MEEPTPEDILFQRTLRQIGNDPSALISALNDEIDNIRWTAARELGNIRDERAVEPLIELLKGKSEYVREEAARALGLIRDKRAVDPLCETLKNAGWCLSESAAAGALGMIGGDRAIDALIAALENTDSDISGSTASGSCGPSSAVIVSSTDVLSINCCSASNTRATAAAISRAV